MKVKLKIGKKAKQRGSLSVEGPVHNLIETLGDLTLGRTKIGVNNLLNVNKRRHVASAGVNILAHAKATWASALDVMKWHIRSSNCQKAA